MPGSRKNRTYCITLCGSPPLLRDSEKREIPLSAGELALLRVLFERPDQTIPWEELIRALGKEPSRYAYKQVSKVIWSLKSKSRKQRVWLGIVTVRGIGFALDPDGPRLCRKRPDPGQYGLHAPAPVRPLKH